MTINIATSIPDFAKDFSLFGFVNKLIEIALPVAGVATLLYIVWGGLSWITAGGDKGKVEEAKNRITGSVIGLIIVAASWSIFSFVNSSLELNLIGKDPDTQIQAPKGFSIIDFGVFTSNIAGIGLTVSAAATLIYLVWGGLSWIMAGGDKGKVEEARNRITGALIGLVIVAASWAIFVFLDYALGLNLTTGSSYSSGVSRSSGGSSGAGIAACPCGGGGCASSGAMGSLGGKCYQCTSSGWQHDPNTTSCQPISCGKCP